MNRRQLLVAYQRAATAISRMLHARKIAKADRRQIEFLVEVDVRMAQLLYLLRRFVELDLEHRRRDRSLRSLRRDDPPGHGGRVAQLNAMGSVIELYGEAYYLFAWRVRDVLRQIAGFGSFDAPGVRGVRNHLIEHPEREPRGVMPRNYVFDCSEGLILKRWGGQPGRFHDAGLYPNATEFVVGLETKLRAAGFDPRRPPRRRRASVPRPGPKSVPPRRINNERARKARAAH